LLTVPKGVIQLTPKGVQSWYVGYEGAGEVMCESGVFGERAGTDAGRAVGAVAQGPISATGFVIQVPGINAWIIGNIRSLPCSFAGWNGINRTVFSTFLTHLAKSCYPEVDWIITLQWQIRDYFTYADTRPIDWGDQFTISPLFTKSGFNRQRYIERQIVD
jgi:hypothetical protein